jgi:hypothetical protein
MKVVNFFFLSVVFREQMLHNKCVDVGHRNGFVIFFTLLRWEKHNALPRHFP